MGLDPVVRLVLALGLSRGGQSIVEGQRWHRSCIIEFRLQTVGRHVVLGQGRFDVRRKVRGEVICRRLGVGPGEVDQFENILLIRSRPHRAENLAAFEGLELERAAEGGASHGDLHGPIRNAPGGRHSSGAIAPTSERLISRLRALPT